MEIMWNRENEIRTEQKTLRRPFIADMQWTLLTDAFIGNKTKWGIVKRSTQWRTEGGLGGSNPPPKFRNFDKVPKIKKILLYEMKFVVPNYSCLQNP
jgi:hypothetical protein